MDNIANDYVNEFSQKLKDFTVFFNEWWMWKSILNKSFADAKGIDLAYWFFMQSFAKKQVDQLADDLPEKGKDLIANLKKVEEQAGQKV